MGRTIASTDTPEQTPATRGVFQGVFHDKSALDDYLGSIYPSRMVVIPT
jgi:hypothetical protein